MISTVPIVIEKVSRHFINSSSLLMSSLFIPKLQGDGLDLRRYVPGKGVRELWWHQAHQIADIAAQCVRCLQQPFANAAVTGRGSPDPF